MKIRAVLFDGNEMPKIVEIENDLQGFYDAIGCSTFEGYSSTELGHLYGFDLFLDGNGKIREDKPMLTGVFVRTETNEIVDTLVGKLLFLCHDDEGESISVPEFADKVVAKHVTMRDFTNIPKVWRDGFGEFETGRFLLVIHC